MAYLCPHPCNGKTEYGYCRYTWCINPLHSNLGTAYQGQGVQKTIITNADRIRAMSDEELAALCESGCPPRRGCPDLTKEDVDKSYHELCQKCWLDWLRQEVSE